MFDEDKSRKELLSFLESQQNYYGTYHHHKETMAWSGVALYFAGVVALANFAPESPSARFAGTLFAIFISAALFQFVMKQHEWRRVGGKIVAKCLELRCNLIGNTLKIMEHDMSPTPLQNTECIFPKKLVELINEQREPTTTKFSIRDFLRQSDKRERLIYSMLLLAFVMSIVMLWIRVLPCEPKPMSAIELRLSWNAGQ